MTESLWKLFETLQHQHYLNPKISQIYKIPQNIVKQIPNIPITAPTENITRETLRQKASQADNKGTTATN